MVPADRLDAAPRVRPQGPPGVPRLVATDLDGTLLRRDGTVGERTARALVAVEAAGARVVLVTGRPLRWMGTLWEHVGAHGVALVSNGALAWDVRAGRPLEVLGLDPAVVRACAAGLRAAVPGTTFALERVSGFTCEPGFGARGAADAGAAPLEALLDDEGPVTVHPAGDPAVKLLARHPDLDPEAFWRQVAAVVGDRLTTTRSAASALVEMSAAGVTKASALQRLCDDLGVAASDVVAFGDMPNDLPMLTWAGRSWAMADAHPAVREAADAVAPDCDEDGVAQVLERLFGLDRR